MGLPALLPGIMQQAVDGIAAARLSLVQQVTLLDGLGRGLVQAAGGVVVMVMAQVGTDEDEGAGAGQQRQGGADPGRVTITHQQRHQGEGGQQQLQEGQMHLQAMLRPVGGIVDGHVGQRQQLVQRGPVQGYLAQGSGKGAGAAAGQPMHGGAVGRP